MITPEQFPYIKSLYVNDCYAYKDFNIELHDYKPFSHLILTGKNGSGKSTILRSVDWFIRLIGGPMPSTLDLMVKPTLFDVPKNSSFAYKNNQNVIYSFLRADRQIKLGKVETVVKESEFTVPLNNELLNENINFHNKFKQYLVNKKVYQAFNQLDNNKSKLSETEIFFRDITAFLQIMLEDESLELAFIRENFEFYIKLSDGRQLTFDILSEGQSSLISILMDLLMRVDLVRKQVNNFSYNPCGIVLIDEPETHLHLRLQEQALPLLTSFFPNIQFITATHSPAVIASIKNATIFDLTTKESRGSEDTVGRSYSDLMMSHFGLNNEYSVTADAIIKQVNDALTQLADKPVEMKAALQKIYDENSAYLSPTLKVELELLIAQQEAHQIAHQ